MVSDLVCDINALRTIKNIVTSTSFPPAISIWKSIYIRVFLNACRPKYYRQLGYIAGVLASYIK